MENLEMPCRYPLFIPLFLLANEKPTNNRKETALGCECLTYCLLVSPPTFLLAPSQQLGQEATTNRQDGSHGISFLPNSLLLRRLSLLLVLPIGEPPSILCHPKQQPSLKVERQVLPFSTSISTHTLSLHSPPLFLDTSPQTLSLHSSHSLLDPCTLSPPTCSTDAEHRTTRRKRCQPYLSQTG